MSNKFDTRYKKKTFTVDERETFTGADRVTVVALQTSREPAMVLEVELILLLVSQVKEVSKK